MSSRDSKLSATEASGHALSLDEARWWARVGVLAALALVLGYIETFIVLPVPVPGVKLGLGNIAVLVALALLAALCWQLFKPYKEAQKLTVK